MTCKKCDGAGWLWWDELDRYYGPALETGCDDTRYSCDACEYIEPNPDVMHRALMRSVKVIKPKMSNKKILKALGDACDLLDIHMCNRANHGNVERTYALWKGKSNEEIMNELWEIYNGAS